MENEVTITFDVVANLFLVEDACGECPPFHTDQYGLADAHAAIVADELNTVYFADC